jgi:hypothetical protein
MTDFRFAIRVYWEDTDMSVLKVWTNYKRDAKLWTQKLQ